MLNQTSKDDGLRIWRRPTVQDWGHLSDAAMPSKPKADGWKQIGCERLENGRRALRNPLVDLRQGLADTGMQHSVCQWILLRRLAVDNNQFCTTSSGKSGQASRRLDHQ